MIQTESSKQHDFSIVVGGNKEVEKRGGVGLFVFKGISYLLYLSGYSYPRFNLKPGYKESYQLSSLT